MQEKQIYYLVQARVLEQGKSEETVEEIDKFFKNGTPKELRAQAFSYFEELRNKYFLTKKYKRLTENKVYSRHKKEDDERVNLQYNKLLISEIEVELMISFGVNFGERFTKEEQLFPIGACGDNFYKIEDILEINLVIECDRYKKTECEFPKNVSESRGYETVKWESFMVKYVSNSHNPKNVYYLILKYMLKNEKNKYSYFETPQFYKTCVKAKCVFTDDFFEDIKKEEVSELQNKKDLYIRELNLLNHLYNIENRISFSIQNIAYTELKELILFGKRLQNIFSSKQRRVHDNIWYEIVVRERYKRDVVKQSFENIF